MLALATAAPMFADEAPNPLPPGAIKQIRDYMPVCSEEAKVTYTPAVHKLPSNLTAAMVRVESKRPSCEGQWLAATSTTGGFFFGIPWCLAAAKAQPPPQGKPRACRR